MKHFTVITVCLLMGVAGCNTPGDPNPNGGIDGVINGPGRVSQEVVDIMALCSGGMRRAASADLTARMEANLKQGGRLTASVSDELRGLFTQQVGTAPTATELEFHRQYVACVDRRWAQRHPAT
jgi:hypothetical protein